MLDGRYLGAQDSDFVEGIRCDIESYIKDGTTGVLIFPPVDNYHRLLIHKTVDEDFPGLTTFSIGEGEGRRTVICPESLTLSKALLMDHNVGIGRKGFGGRGQARGRPSHDRWYGDQDSDHWGESGPRGGRWAYNRPSTLPRQRGKWEHDDRVGPNSPQGGQRARGQGRATGRAATVSPQFPKKNISHDQSQYRRGSSDWTGKKNGPRVRQDSEGSWANSPHYRGQQPSPHMGHRGSDNIGNARRGLHEPVRVNRSDEMGEPDRNGPEGAELDGLNKQKSIGRNRRPDAQVYVPRPRRQQTEDLNDGDASSIMSDLPPQGLIGRPSSARRNPRVAMDVYVPRVRRAEQEPCKSQETLRNKEHMRHEERSHDQYSRAGWQHNSGYYPPDIQQENCDIPPEYNQQRRRKSADSTFSPATERRYRGGQFDNRNWYKESYDQNPDQYYESNTGWERVPEQTFYNQSIRGHQGEDRNDNQPPEQTGHNRWQRDDRTDRPPSRNRRRRRSHSNSSRKSQPSPNRTNFGNQGQNQREQGRRASDAWAQDDYQKNVSRGRRLSDTWSQDEGYDGQNSLRRLHRSSSSHQFEDNHSGHHANEPWSSTHPNEPWSPTHRPNEHWSPTHQPPSPSWSRKDRGKGRVRHSSGSHNKEESWSPNQCQNEPWTQNEQQLKAATSSNEQQRIRRFSGGRNPEESWNPTCHPKESRRMRQSSESWSQDEYSSLDRTQRDKKNPQRGKRWQNDAKSPRQNRRGNRIARNTASESWSSDVDNWESDSRVGAPSGPQRAPQGGRIIIEVTPGGRNVSDATSLIDASNLDYETHDESLLEESVRAQASDVTDKVRSMCAGLSELPDGNEESAPTLDVPAAQHSEVQQTFDSDSNLQDYNIHREGNYVSDSASSSTRPSHQVITYIVQPAPIPHIDPDDFSSDGQSSVQPESSTSAESPDAADSANVSSAGERESSPGYWSPTLPEANTESSPPDLKDQSGAVNGMDTEQSYVIGETSATIIAVPNELEQDTETPATYSDNTKVMVGAAEQDENIKNQSIEVTTGHEEAEKDSEIKEEVHPTELFGENPEQIQVCPKEESEPLENDQDSRELQNTGVEGGELQTEIVQSADQADVDDAEEVTVPAGDKKEPEEGEKAAEKIPPRELTLEEMLNSDTPLPKVDWAELMEQESGEDSWDHMFDDTGEAFDPNLLQELTLSVGKPVAVRKPRSQFDYYNYQPKDPDMDDRSYGHLVEIYDFPTEFVSRDIHIAFKEFQDRGFDIKWVDDSHAIGIFASPIAAEAALHTRHALMKIRPISQASRQTKMKAKKCAEFLEPYRTRPETTAAVARNLVTGALGLKSRIPREKRDAERTKLREAREKKRSAQRQKRDAWEGTFGKCAMDG